MSRCKRMADVGRRKFLQGGAFAVAGAATAGMAAAPATVQAGALVDYPSNRLANVSDLKLNEPLEVEYPDENAPGVLLKLGKAVEGGVGPNSDIVGFTTICPHKGFAMNYDGDSRTFNCYGHYSVFDVEAGGQQTFGHATQNLPQYILRVDDKGDVYAEGVDELLYGRLSNVL